MNNTDLESIADTLADIRATLIAMNDKASRDIQHTIMSTTPVYVGGPEIGVHLITAYIDAGSPRGLTPLFCPLYGALELHADDLFDSETYPQKWRYFPTAAEAQKFASIVHEDRETDNNWCLIEIPHEAHSWGSPTAGFAVCEGIKGKESAHGAIIVIDPKLCAMYNGTHPSHDWRNSLIGKNYLYHCPGVDVATFGPMWRGDETTLRRTTEIDPSDGRLRARLDHADGAPADCPRCQEIKAEVNGVSAPAPEVPPEGVPS